jgi:hypothetical protein
MPRAESTVARHADVFAREFHFDWRVPAFKTWARKQRYEG